MQYTTNLGMMRTWNKSSMPWDRIPHRMETVCRAKARTNETVDVYRADLRRLAVPFGGATDHALVSPKSLRLDELEIDEQLARAQNILKDTELVAAAARMTETLRGNMLQVIPLCQGYKKA